MPRFPDKVDLYDDRGNLMDTKVPVDALSPLLNPAIKKIISIIKRAVAVDLRGIERALATGAVGGRGCIIRGRELKLNVVANANAIADKLEKLIRVKPGDDTEVKVLKNGESLLVMVPSLRIEAGVEYTTAFTTVAAALCCALIDIFKISMWDYDMVHAAVWGRYPQSVDPMGANVSTLLAVPQQNEGMGYALRNIPAAHIAIITRKNAMNAAALSAILEHAAMYEMGDAIGPFERYQLLGLAYQGLNANNIVYDLVKENGKSGTLGDVVRSTVKRALADGVIRPLKKLPSGFVLYASDDIPLWNAYAAAGLLAGTMITCGAARAMQHVTSVLVYFNDLIERETGLPGVDFGRAEGTGIEMSFFSHSIYGGGNPAVFHGNHIVTRHSKGFVIPCVAAAVALDAGTVYYDPERMSGVVGEVLGEIPELREPLKYVNEAASKIKGEV
ncbi:MAG: coenzyme-B sulfoethylthiotransferase subunit beta [Candidatus Nezhaarchaeota archaeon]|nr:coenzyme-B sulfoethylthiotransferase subunit beta [Candidatus Nezhaarchaeota archaeon]MCX8141672.1 coenzyme-B sulfoethylthiotransferase subunit beta [Candidatus Nezhaarchaeota archaeon]MDW8049939.1 coenzyme-B sulfoethylthiotransferase subunit beta [Nitrososphaerota archaeon]